MGNAFVDGFKEGMSQAEEAHEQGTTNISAGILSPMTLSLWPKSLAATSDKLFNQIGRVSCRERVYHCV